MFQLNIEVCCHFVVVWTQSKFSLKKVLPCFMNTVIIVKTHKNTETIGPLWVQMLLLNGMPRMCLFWKSGKSPISPVACTKYHTDKQPTERRRIKDCNIYFSL